MADTAVASPIKSDHNSRKNKKPLMEKRRRARINSCLSQLKALVLQAIKKDSSQFSKLEKADILELTVKHLRALQRQQAAGAMTSDPNVVSKYRAGFNECAKEVMRYMGSVREVHDEVKERVLGHLAGCLQVVNHVTPAESIQQQQGCMKPLHVHIPGQGGLGGAPSASAVVMQTQAGLPPHPIAYTPSPVGSSSPDSRLSASPVHSMPMTTSHHNGYLSRSSRDVTGVVTTPTTTLTGAYKIVSTAACPGGAVALYLGGTRGEGMSVDAVPLYSVALPQSDGAVTAFVPPASSTPASHHHATSHSHHVTSYSHHSTSYLTSHAHNITSNSQAMDSRVASNVSPVRMDYTSLTTSLPVDLRQKVKTSPVFMDSRMPITIAQCSPSSLSDEKLWRPW